MSKHAAIIFLAIFTAVLPFLGFPGWFRTALFVVSGLSIATLAYFSSVIYCSNCKKLIDDAGRALDEKPPSLFSREIKSME